MQENHSVLGDRAFGRDADSLTVIKYRSHHDALKFLQSALRGPTGISLLYGPEGSGKSVIARELAMQLSSDSDVAYVDGRQIKPHGLLTRMLKQFGQAADAGSDKELFRQVSEFVLEQARSWQAPVLIVDNVDRMYPSALRLLDALAALAMKGRFALRMVLTGDKSMQTLIESDGMTNFIQRDPVMYSLLPLSSRETMIYLHARMQAAGSERADTIFPFDVCDRLRELSGGWPGKLNQFALEAIKRSDGFPVSVVDTYAPGEEALDSSQQLPVLGKREAVSRLPPKLIVTRDGDTLSEFTFREKKVLIGRSDFADVIVDDDYVSKIHAVLLLYADAMVILDLNSANGTTVNSVKVRKTILRDEDIISLGRHRLKVENAPEIGADVEELLKSPDTIKMKNLVDLRRQRARRRMQAVKNRTG